MPRPKVPRARGGGKEHSGDFPTRTLSMHMLAGIEIGGQAAEAQQGKRRRREPENSSQKDGDGQGVVHVLEHA